MKKQFFANKLQTQVKTLKVLQKNIHTLDLSFNKIGSASESGANDLVSDGTLGDLVKLVTKQLKLNNNLIGDHTFLNALCVEGLEHVYRCRAEDEEAALQKGKDVIRQQPKPIVPLELVDLSHNCIVRVVPVTLLRRCKRINLSFNQLSDSAIHQLIIEMASCE